MANVLQNKTKPLMLIKPCIPVVLQPQECKVWHCSGKPPTRNLHWHEIQDRNSMFSNLKRNTKKLRKRFPKFQTIPLSHSFVSTDNVSLRDKVKTRLVHKCWQNKVQENCISISKSLLSLSLTISMIIQSGPTFLTDNLLGFVSYF